MDKNYNTKNPYFDNVNKPFKGNIQNPPLSSQYNYNAYQNKMPSLNKSEDIISVYSSTFKTGCKNNDLTMDQIIDEIKLEQKLQNKNTEIQNQLNLSNFHSSQFKSNSQVEKNKKFQNKNTKNNKVNIVDSFQQEQSLQYDSENQSESNSSYEDNKKKNKNSKKINENFDSNNSYTDSDSDSESEEKSISIQDMNSQFKFKYDSSFPSVRKNEEILNQNDDSQMKFTLQRQAQEETIYSNSDQMLTEILKNYKKLKKLQFYPNDYQKMMDILQNYKKQKDKNNGIQEYFKDRNYLSQSKGIMALFQIKLKYLTAQKLARKFVFNYIINKIQKNFYFHNITHIVSQSQFKLINDKASSYQTKKPFNALSNTDAINKSVIKVKTFKTLPKQKQNPKIKPKQNQSKITSIFMLVIYNLVTFFTLRFLKPVKPIGTFFNVVNFINHFMIVVNLMYVPIKVGFEYNIWSYQYIYIIFFAFEIILNLNTGFYKDGQLILKKKDIINQYLKGKGIIDILTFLSLLLELIFNKGDYLIWIYLFKLKQIFNYIAYIDELFQLQRKYYAKFELGKLIVFIFFVSHIMGCGFYYIAKIQIESNYQTNWVEFFGYSDVAKFDLYVYSFYYAVITMSTVGYGDINPVSVYERIYGIVMTLVSCAIFGYFLSTIQNIFMEHQKKLALFNMQKYQLQSYMSNRNIGQQLQIEVIKHLEYQLKIEQEGYSQSEKILNNLPKVLSDQIKKKFYGSILRKTRQFYCYSTPFLEELSLYMTERTYLPKEILYEIGDEMKDSKEQQKVDVKQQQNETENQLQQKLLSSQNLFFIHKGKIEIYGKLQKVSVDNVMEQQMDIEAEEFIIGDIKDGDILGYFSFITQQSRNVSARAASISQVLQLNRDAFLSIIKKYPIDYEIFCQTRDQFLQQGQALNCLSCGFNGHTSVECPRMIVKNLVSHNYLNSLLYREKEEELQIFQRRNSDCTVLRRGFQYQNQSQKNTQKSYYSIVSQNTLGSKSYKKMRKRRKSLRKFYINFSMGKINSLFYKEIIRKKVKVYREKYVKYQQQFSQTWEEQEENQTFYNEILKNLIAQNDKTVNILDKESVINSNKKRSKGKKQSYHIQFQEVHEESEENEEDEDFYTSNNTSSILEDDDYSSGLRIKDEDKQFLQNTASIKIVIKDQVTLFFLQYYRIKMNNNIYSFKDYQTYKILDFTQDLKSTMRWPTLTQNTQPYLIIDKGGNITQSQVEVIDRRLTQQFTGLSQKKNSYFQKQQRKEGSRSSLIDINELNATSNDVANKRNGKVRNMSLQISNLNSIQPKSKRNTILSDFDMSRQTIRNSQFQQLPPFGSLSNRNINTSFEDQIDKPQFADQNLSQLMQLQTTNRHSQQLQSNNQVQQAIDENEEILKSSTGGDFSEIYNYQQMKLQHLNLQKQNSQHQSQSQYNQNTHITQGTENNNNNQAHSYQDINLQRNASYKRKSSAKVKSVWTNDNEDETTENYNNYYNPNNYGLVSSRSTFVTMNSNLKNQHLQVLDEIRKKKVSKELYFYDFETFYDTTLVEKQFQRFTGKAFQKSIYFPQNDIRQVIDEFVKYMGKKHKKEVFKKQIFVNDQNLVKILKKNQVEIDFIKQIYQQQKDPSQDSKIFIPNNMQFLVETLYNREKKYIKKIFTSKSHKSIYRDKSQSQLSQTQRNQLKQTPTTQSFQQINQIVQFEQHKVNSKNSHQDNFLLSRISNDHNQIFTKQNNESNEKAVQD